MIAALFVETGGCYFGCEGVEPWDEARDARRYPGPWPAVCHPDCKRWGRFASSHPTMPGAYVEGDDGGCFAGALAAVNLYGGVIEHPAGSKAWLRKWFDIGHPPAKGGWVKSPGQPGWTCCVEQGHYGHFSRKRTWLYAFGVVLPELIWGPSPQRLPAYAVERHGYEKARRIGVMAAVGGKDKTRIRNATPPEFRNLLLSISRTSVFG